MLKEMCAKIVANLLPPRLMRAKRFFSLWERRGYHVTPVHYHELIPDTREFADELWSRQSALAGIDMREPFQLELLRRFASQYKGEYDGFPYAPTQTPYDFYFNNGSYETVDAEVLHCMIRDRKPRRVVEIGSGFSTRITAAALRRNRADDPARQCELTCIEPYPSGAIKRGFEGLTRLIEAKVQDVPLDVFLSLEENDVLFIDSSHVVTVGSDVCYEFLEVLPRLKQGVLVHVHDILLPQVYSREWFEVKVFWNEQYLLQAFLAFNNAFQVLWAANFMHLRHPEDLSRAFASYAAFKNSSDQRTRLYGHKSFWMQKVR